jgi:hypothetical protein
MKRIPRLPIEHCWNCPYFEEKNDYVLRYVACPLIDKKIIRHAGDDETKRVESELAIWFEKECPLDVA